MKMIAFLAMASATATLTPAATASGVSNGSIPIGGPIFVSGYKRSYATGSVSRPDRFAGEASLLRRYVSGSSGSFSLGDFAAVGSRDTLRVVNDFLVGAAIVFQSIQTPLDRDIQEVVSENFELYWD